MPKIILKGFIIVPRQDLDGVKTELINHKRLTLAEPGCLVLRLFNALLTPIDLLCMKSSLTETLLSAIKLE